MIIRRHDFKIADVSLRVGVKLVGRCISNLKDLTNERGKWKFNSNLLENIRVNVRKMRRAGNHTLMENALIASACSDNNVVTMLRNTKGSFSKKVNNSIIVKAGHRKPKNVWD